jgi:hypothetical protein
MSSSLGPRQATGTLNANNPYVAGAWTVAFDPATLSLPNEFEIWHIAINGPSASSMKIYIDTVFFSNVARGDINDWDPSQVLPMLPVRSCSFTGTRRRAARPRSRFSVGCPHSD